MENRLGETDWKLLLRRIKSGNCTPFIGSGACYGILPTGRQMAEDWAKQFEYPLEDKDNLVRVAQYLAIQHDPMFPKEEILAQFKKATSPDFKDPTEPHRVLAELPLPIYITTNYDKFMVQALQQQNKAPKRELCRWNKYLKHHPTVFDAADFEPSPANPIVFHLHGHDEVAESLVLTEDDYLDFLVNVSRDEDIIPLRIQRAITGSSLLFIGYAISDWDFRVLFRSLVTYLERTLVRSHVSVQIVPTSNAVTQEQKNKAQDFLNQYYEGLNVRVYWGSARDFAVELRQRWEEFNSGI